MSSSAALSSARRRRGHQSLAQNAQVSVAPPVPQPQLTMPQMVLQSNARLGMLEARIPEKMAELEEKIKTDIKQSLTGLNVDNTGSGEIDFEALLTDMGFITERLQNIEQQLEKLNGTVISTQSFAMKTQESLDEVKKVIPVEPVETNDANVGENVETNDANVGENVETVNDPEPKKKGKGKNKKTKDNIVMEVEEALS
jgi:hypothetical protein